MKEYFAIVYVIWISIVASVFAEDGVVVDILTSQPAQSWVAAHDIDEIKSVEDGFSLLIKGDDPYVVSPVFELPVDKPWLVKLKILSSQAGTAQLFYFQDEATEKDSVRFPVSGKGEEEIVFTLPRIGRNSRFRFDPPGYPGLFTLKDARLIERNEWIFPTCVSPDLREIDAPIVFENQTEGSRGVRIHQDPKDLQRFEFWFGDDRLGVNHNLLPIGYLMGNEAKWFTPLFRIRSVEQKENSLEFDGESTDPNGAVWCINRRLEKSKTGIVLHTKYSCSADREVIFSPVLMLLQDRKLSDKCQSIFPGVEYLGNEPSSSHVDIEGLAAERRVPLSYKITIPCMATVSDGKWFSLSWRQKTNIAAFFDFPARTFAIDSNSFGLIIPGANASTRVDGEVLPFEAFHLGKDQVIEAECELNAGLGKSITGAVENWLERTSLPKLPVVNHEAYHQSLFQGWVNPSLGSNGLFRHALDESFPPQFALDAAAMIQWLANSKTLDSRKNEVLFRISSQARTVVPEGQFYTSRIGHLQKPVGSLFPEVVVGAVEEASRIADDSLRRYDERSIARYLPSPGKLDYSRNHFSSEVNGLAAERTVTALKAALFSGDRDLIDKALEKVRWLDRWDNSVPRGAQSWEIPIHTPDLLAAAHLTHAYALAYSINNDPSLLHRAKQWALCGLPFIYLSSPTENSVGPYASIAVYGATKWVAPVWIGLPVQWCGLVYADALYELSKSDSGGKWKAIADGIVLSAIQQTYPTGHERAGLLPDSFDLNAQIRNPFDINPATLQPLALPLSVSKLVNEVKVLQKSRIILFAPGSVDILEDQEKRVIFSADVSIDAAVLLHALKGIREVKVDGSVLPKGGYLPIRSNCSIAIPLRSSSMPKLIELLLE